MFYVEHSFLRKMVGMKASFKLIAALSIIVLFAGCEKPDPNPEFRDPIYGDLQKESDSAVKDVESAKTEADKLTDDISKLEPRDPSRSVMVNQRVAKNKAEAGSRQRANYFKIRAEQRRDTDRRDYLRAFDAKKLWPDPNEFKNYEVMRKLQTTSRSWDDRVPKNTRNDKGGPKPPKGEKKVEKATGSAE